MNNHITQKILFLFLGVSFIVSGPGILYSQEKVERSVMEFAQKSLSNYVIDTLTETNSAKFNFRNLGEAKTAQLGDPFKVMFIGLDSLKNYKAGTGIKPIMIDAQTLWFPVMVGTEIRTKMEVVNKEGRLVAGEFGGTRRVLEIAKVQNQLSKLMEVKGIERPYKSMLLKIPALNAEFLFIDSSKGEILLSAMIQPQRYNLENGRIYDADEVLLKLKEFAKRIEGKKVM